MATLLYWRDKKSGQTQFVQFDAITAETHEALMAITSHPVEEGADVSDHARPEAERITIEGTVSSKPLFTNPGVEKLMSFGTIPLKLAKKKSGISLNTFTPGGLTRAVTGFVSSLLHPEPKSFLGLKATAQFPNRGRDLHTVLTRARFDGALVTVVSPNVQVLDNMMIERVAVPRTPEAGTSLPIQIDLKQVRIVKSETVDAPQPAEARGKPQNNKGSQAAKKADDAKLEKLKSIGAGAADSELGQAVTGLFKKPF